MPASSLPSFSDPAHAPSVAPTSAPTGTPTAAHLRADGISLSYGARRVLTDVSLTVSAGERAGLIGENGSGKSTLLRILAGLQEPDVGTVRATAPGGRIPRIGLLHQDMKPVKQICAHLNAFHAYADNPGQCVEANHFCSHLNEGKWAAGPSHV